MDEQIEQLKVYIRQQIQGGVEPNVIASHLHASGWPPEAVEQAFKAVQATMIPTVQQANAPGQSATIPPPQVKGSLLSRIKTGWLILKQSVKVLNGNKYLLRYLAMTYLWVVILTIGFVALFLGFREIIYDPNSIDPGSSLSLLGFALVFVNYVVIYFVINFYAAALAANMLQIFLGRNEPFSAFTKLAWSKAPTIFLFSLIQATVGIILEFIVERIRFIGWFLSWLLGTMWSLGTLFVLPIIVTSDASAPKAIKQSVNFFKATWGENITAKVTVNTPLALINIAVIAVFWPLFFVVMMTGSLAGVLAVLIAFLFVQLTIAIIGSFANSLLNVSLFYYATYHQVPPSFDAELLNRVFVKRKRRFFGKDKQASVAG